VWNADLVAEFFQLGVVLLLCGNRALDCIVFPLITDATHQIWSDKGSEMQVPCLSQIGGLASVASRQRVRTLANGAQPNQFDTQSGL